MLPITCGYAGFILASLWMLRETCVAILEIYRQFVSAFNESKHETFVSGFFTVRCARITSIAREAVWGYLKKIVREILGYRA